MFTQRRGKPRYETNGALPVAGQVSRVDSAIFDGANAAAQAFKVRGTCAEIHLPAGRTAKIECTRVLCGPIR